MLVLVLGLGTWFVLFMCWVLVVGVLGSCWFLVGVWLVWRFVGVFGGSCLFGSLVCLGFRFSFVGVVGWVVCCLAFWGFVVVCCLNFILDLND